MRARSTSDVSSIHQAYALLGLTGPADAEVVAAAFRTTIKAARPDIAGGDAERFRQTIAAWRLIQRQAVPLALSAPVEKPPAPPVVGITPSQALAGGMSRVRVAGRDLRVRVPAGVRTGEHLRLKAAGTDGEDLFLPVVIRGADGMHAVGDDLHMRWPISHRLVEDGGRLEIETHAGVRSAWIVADQPLCLRLKNLGLPARGARAQGHLFVTLDPCDDAPSAAEDLLARFTRVWTPDRLAA
jgi:curved DNA-binding protein